MSLLTKFRISSTDRNSSFACSFVIGACVVVTPAAVCAGLGAVVCACERHAAGCQQCNAPQATPSQLPPLPLSPSLQPQPSASTAIIKCTQSFTRPSAMPLHAQSDIGASPAPEVRRPARRPAPRSRNLAARQHRLDSRHRRRPRPLAQRHGHQLHPGTCSPAKAATTSCSTCRAAFRATPISLPNPDALLLETAAAQIAALMALLDHFIIMDDVELADRQLSPVRPARSPAPKPPRCSEQIGLTVADSRTNSSCRAASWNSARRHRHPRLQPTGPPLRALGRRQQPLEALSQALSERRSRPLRPAKPRMAAPPRRNAALRHRHPRPRAAAGDRTRPAPCTSPKAAISARRSSSASARAATSIAPSRAFRLEGELPDRRRNARSRRQAGRRTHQRRRHSAARRRRQTCSSPSATSAARPSTAICRFNYPGGTAVPVAHPFTTAEAHRAATSI